MEQKIVCPSCGNETNKIIDSVCKECFLKTFELFQAPLVIHVKICPRCGAFRQKNRWLDGQTLEEIINRHILEFLCVYEKTQDVSIGIHVHEMTPHMYAAYIDVRGTVDGIEVYKDFKTEVRLKREACDMCSRQAGGYFEAVVQLRALNRHISDSEMKEGKKTISETVETDRKKGDKLAFITEYVQLKEGGDFYIGSTSAARHACSKIVEEMGGSLAESYTLVGMKEGKENYRTTFLIRLPEFRKGDVILYENKLIEIKKSSKRTSGKDLTNGSNFLIKTEELKNIQKLGNVYEDFKTTILVDEEENALLILDPETYETVTIPKPAAFNKEPGSEIKVFKTEYGTVALQQKDA